MFIGLDIGGTSVKGIITDDQGTVYAAGRIPTGVSTIELCRNCNDLVQQLCVEADFDRSKIKAIGAGVAGAVNCRKGVVVTSPNIPFLKNTQLAEKLQKTLGAPVAIENDATIAVLGEGWKGNGAKYSNWFMLNLGTGIGGGAVVDGRVLLGRDGFAAEFGHMIIESDGRQCACGNKGCLEAYASATALVRYAEQLVAHNGNKTVLAGKNNLTAKDVADAAKAGDSCALDAIQNAASYLGIGIVNLVHVFNPEAVIIGGGVSRAYSLLLPVIKNKVDEHCLAGLNKKIHFHQVKHEDQGPGLGAIKMMRDRGY